MTITTTNTAQRAFRDISLDEPIVWGDEGAVSLDAETEAHLVETYDHIVYVDRDVDGVESGPGDETERDPDLDPDSDSDSDSNSNDVDDVDDGRTEEQAAARIAAELDHEEPGPHEDLETDD